MRTVASMPSTWRNSWEAERLIHMPWTNPSLGTLLLCTFSAKATIRRWGHQGAAPSGEDTGSSLRGLAVTGAIGLVLIPKMAL